MQVGSKACIIDGNTDELTYIDLETSGIGAIDVRKSTNHAYLVNSMYTVVVDGDTQKTFQLIPSEIPQRSGGMILPSVEINQQTGRVYVINDDIAGIITILQDLDN